MNSPCPGDDAEPARRARCPRCTRPLTHCLCPLIPSLDNRTPVVILQHPQESRHALNTARLAALGLRQARLLCGARFDASAWTLAGYTPVLLFPGEDAAELQTSAADETFQRRVLVVPDATWRHARGMIHHSPALAALPRVTLPAGPAGQYRVRKAPADTALSTVEAVARALDLMDAPARHDALLRPFQALVEGQISAMGRAVYGRNYADPHPR